jgi:ribosome maturation factor RimP
MSWQIAVEKTVAALGYELVDAERSSGGLLRVFIDKAPAALAGDAPASGAGEPDFITVEDCEKVTRQLQHVLEVEGVDYARLEVSSPGLDRPLKRPADWLRFAGETIDLTLRMPFQGRKKWRGVLVPNGEGWRIVFHDGKVEQALDFTLSEVREARLVPVLNFKGRRAAVPAAAEEQGKTDR